MVGAAQDDLHTTGKETQQKSRTNTRPAAATHAAPSKTTRAAAANNQNSQEGNTFFTSASTQAAGSEPSTTASATSQGRVNLTAATRALFESMKKNLPQSRTLEEQVQQDILKQILPVLEDPHKRLDR